MEWGKFLACLFLGGFGVHKFMEKKTGWGVAYLLTGGLLGFGWLYDTIGYLLRGVMGERAESADGLPGALAGLAPQKRLVARTVMWMIAVISIFNALLLFPSFTGLFALGIAVVAAPIPKWRAMLDKEIKWPFQIAIASGLLVMSLLFLPTVGITSILFVSATDAAAPAESPAVTAMAETAEVPASTANAAEKTESPAPTAAAAAAAATPTPTPEPTPTPTAAPTATPTATPEPTAAATPEATEEATPEPTVEETPEPTQEEEEARLSITKWKKTVEAGEDQNVKIKGKPNTEYTITVEYKTQMSTAKGLIPKTSDNEGIVKWSWKVGSRSTPGSTCYITVSGGGESETVEFTIAE